MHASPIIVGARTTSGQLYASTTAVTMRRVLQRATVAVVGLALTVAALGAAGRSDVERACEDVTSAADIATCHNLFQN